VSIADPIMRIPVGVVVERRKAKSQWVEHVWRPVAALEGVPDAKPWSELSASGDAATFYVGAVDVELHRAETGNYRENLISGAPALWVVLRPTEVEPPYELITVTADPSEGEGYTQTGTDLVGPVPMPESLRRTLEAFVAAHHVERTFFKRKRDRADPESLARRDIARGSRNK
jgi:hypothetical protein